MNLAQSLGAAAAALVLALTSSGVSPTQAVARITAEARAYLETEPMFARAEREPCAQERRTIRAPLDAEMMKWADRIA
ncbi:MAG: hypothetical protein JNL81_06840 [Hyphomonadaceae bacterium]|nr:hypothetical protein [Hyphomonadaceae bacterium]